MGKPSNRRSAPIQIRHGAVWGVLAAAAIILVSALPVSWPPPLDASAQVSDTTSTLDPVITGSESSTVVPGTIAGTPVPVGTPTPATTTTTTTAAPAAPAANPDRTTGQDGQDGADGADGQPGQPGEDGQPGQPGTDVVVVDDGSGGKRDKDEDQAGRAGRDERERGGKKERDGANNGNGSGRDQNGNGGVAEVVAPPPLYNQQMELEQQDGVNATAGATGESGTVNGEPRETAETAPVTTGPGQPLLPAGVNLPPPVPGLPPLDAQVTDPGVAGQIMGTTELVFDAVSDTTVFSAAPDSPQTPESAALLALGGPQGAMALMSFDVSGVGEGSVLGARLTFNGAGAAGASGGGVGVIYDYVVEDGITANGAPGADTALNVQGAPAWFERVEPGALSAVDVSGSVFGDGAITFVLSGQPEAQGAIHAVESGAPAQLILTVGLPA